MTARLFVAVAMPPSLQPIIDAAIEPWRERFPRARWVPPGDRHVTLKFLGGSDPGLLKWVHDRSREVAAGVGSFSVRLDGLGAFPSPRRARVLWVGLEDPDARLAALASGLDSGLAPEFDPERRPFTPHVTVARSEPPLRLSEELSATPVLSETFTVGEIVLMRSRPARPAGRRASQRPSTYEVLGSFPLSS